jgi:beta-phosphoglucomutase-like phosphatase (HAD superfamily)
MLKLRGFGEIRALGLDLDGTLLLTEELNLEAVRVTCAEFGLEVPPNLADLVVGRTNNAIFGTMLALQKGAPLPGWERMVETLSMRKRAYFAQHVGEVGVVPGATEIIRATRGLLLRAIVTAASNRSLNAGLGRLGFGREEFNILLPADYLRSELYPKPHPDHWREAARLLGYGHRPSLVLAVEDSPKGIFSARGAGLLVCGITTTHSAEALLRAGADFTVDSFAELAGMLGLIL